MAGRAFSLSQYLRDRTAEIDPLFAFDAPTEPEARKWRARALAKARDLLGEQPQFVPLEAEIIDQSETESYRCQRLIFDADPHSSVPALVYTPKALSEPGPAVVCIHDAGSSKEQCDFARHLAARGYVTLAFDLRCFGERADSRETAPGLDSCERFCAHASLLGISIVALHIHDTVRAVEFLQELPQVDERRIGCVGLGLGGLVAMWATGTDKKLRTAIIAGCLCEMDDLLASAPAMQDPTCLPALRRYFDLCDIASLIAPRPLMVQSAEGDSLIPVESARRAYSRLATAYTVWGVPESVSHDVFAGPHQLNTATALDWLDRHL